MYCGNLKEVSIFFNRCFTGIWNVTLAFYCTLELMEMSIKFLDNEPIVILQIYFLQYYQRKVS